MKHNLGATFHKHCMSVDHEMKAEHLKETLISYQEEGKKANNETKVIKRIHYIYMKCAGIYEM